MKRTRIITAVAALLLVTAGFWLYRRNGNVSPAYRFATVERGDLEAAVSATGALSAVTTVQVGTQVSGQISAIHVDFNDRVKKGQLIARIDPTLQQQAVREAQAGLERSQAELQQTEREYERKRQLYYRKVITESEFHTAQYQLAVARANLKSAQVTLDRARQNLAYTSIYAPIEGIVVERNVDVGQTVAASLSAPQLFLLANDLTRMQILASVDESDIGAIHQGQPVRFTVQAYPHETFTGAVRQVRLQSTTLENVVNYTVVVEVKNPSGKLLPGLTATVEFLTGSASNVLMVQNAALRFRPTAEMLAEVRQRRPAQRGSAIDVDRAPDSTPGGRRDGTRRIAGAQPNEAARVRQPGNATMLWYLDRNGKLAVTPVRTGVTDGQKTEIQGRGITEGMQIIVGVVQSTQVGESGSTSPFGAPAQVGPPRPGGF